MKTLATQENAWMDSPGHELKAILQHVSIPAWMVDSGGYFIWVNDAYKELFGDRTGQHFAAVVPAKDMPLVLREFRRKLAGAPASDYEISALLPDGRRVQTEVSTVRLDPDRYCGAVFGMAVPRSAPTAETPTYLTPRQNEVLQLLAVGASTDQIAEELFLSQQTVRNHVRQILRALRAHSRLEAVVKARREGIIVD
jgi:DNA-binding CsgD family transcriptional regulator